MRRILLLFLSAFALNAQTPPAWPNADSYWGALVNVDAGAVQSYLNGSPAWFSNVKLATDVESLAVDWTNPTSLSTATTNYNNSVAALTGRGILTGNYISGSNVVTATSNLTEYPAGVVLLANMPGGAQYCGTWPGQPWRQIICVTDGPTVTAFDNQVKAQWQAFPTQIHFVDNAASAEGGALGVQPWASQMANLSGLNTIAQSLGTRAIFNISIVPGQSLNATDMNTLVSTLAGAGIAIEQPWQSTISSSPTLTAAAVAQYRKLLDAGIAVVMIASGAAGQATPQQLATWVSTWRKPGDKLYLNQPFFKAPDPLAYNLPQPKPTVNCTNNSTDAAAIQNAVNGGGTVTISGTCSLGTNTITISNAVSLTGTASLVASSTATAYAFVVASDNVSFNGLTFTNAGVHLAGSHDLKRNAVNFTGCTFQHFNASTGSSAMHSVILVDPIWRNSTFTGNTITDAWYQGFSNTNTGNAAAHWNFTNTDTYAIHGILMYGGLDNTRIEFNTFSQISGTGIKLFADGLSSQTLGYTASGVSVSYNTLTLVHRSGFEMQNMDSPSNCTGGCNGFAIAFSNPKYAGNYFHTPAWIYHGLFGFTIPIMSTGSFYINNLAALDIIGNPTGVLEDDAYAFELPPGTACCGTNVFGGGATIQGNVIRGDDNPSFSNQGWRAGIASYGAANPQIIQNQIMCGASSASLGSNSFVGQNNPNIDPLNNYAVVGCPGGGGTGNYLSNIAAAFTSANNRAFPSGGNGTWTLTATDNIPIRNVQFFIDNSTTPVVMQEVQDASTTFSADRTWKYHATFNTSTLANGAHTIVATTTDISGTASSTPAQQFTTGPGGVFTVTCGATPKLLPSGSLTCTATSAVTWSVPAGSTASISSPGPSTTVTVTAPATPVYAKHSQGGCPSSPNDSVWNTPITALPVHAKSAQWLTDIAPEPVGVDQSWEPNILDNSTPITTGAKWFYTTDYNNASLQFPGVYSGYGENGKIAARIGINDHHIESVNAQNCQWYETYNDQLYRPNSTSCTRIDGTGCTATSFYQYNGYSYAMPSLNTLDTNETGGTTDAAGLPLEPLTLHLSELLSGTIKHALRFTPSIGFNQAGYTPSGCSGCTTLWPASGSVGVASIHAVPFGARLRLKQSFTPGGTCGAGCQTILTALKTYGMVDADNANAAPLTIGSDVASDPRGATAVSDFKNLVMLVGGNFDIVDESSFLTDTDTSHGLFITTSPYTAVYPANPYVVPSNSLMVCATGSTTICVPIAAIPTSVGWKDPFARYIQGGTYTPQYYVNGSAATPTFAITNCSGGGCGSITVGGVYTAPAIACGGTQLSFQLTAMIGSAVDTQYATVEPTPSSSAGCALAFDNGATVPYTGTASQVWNADTFNRFGQIIVLNTSPGNSNFSAGPNGAVITDPTIYQSAGYAFNDFYIGPIYGLAPGNYNVTFYFGQGGGGFGGVCDSRSGWWSTGGSFNGETLDMNGVLASSWLNPIGDVGYQCFVPVTATGPMLVTSSTAPTYIASHTGEFPVSGTTPGGASAVKIVPDTGTPLHISIDLEGPPSIAAGTTRLVNDVPWFIAGYDNSATVWSILSGPGSISKVVGPLTTQVTYTPPVSQTVTGPVVIQAVNGIYSATATLYVTGPQSLFF